MIQIFSNLKRGELKLKPENKDDLWCLSQIIDSVDEVKGRTLRKIKAGTEEKASVIRKPVFLSIKVEKVELSDTLRILGTVAEGSEDIPKGVHHSFIVEENFPITIIKEKWLSFQLEKVKEACSAKQIPVMIAVFDREECFIALMKRQGYDVIAHLEGSVEKKGIEERVSGNFYDEIVKKLEEINERQRIEHVIIASPAFWKEELVKRIKNESLKRKIATATCSSVGESAINEVLKRKEIQSVMKEDRATKEINLVENLFEEIAKEGKAAYGIKDVQKTAESGAVEVLLVTDGLIKKSRDEKKYPILEKIMKTVDSMNGEVHLISSEHDGGKRLDGLGGIGGILRYKLNY